MLIYKTEHPQTACKINLNGCFARRAGDLVQKQKEPDTGARHRRQVFLFLRINSKNNADVW